MKARPAFFPVHLTYVAVIDFEDARFACESSFWRSREAMAELIRGATLGEGSIGLLLRKRRENLQQLQVSVAQLSALAHAACEAEDQKAVAILVESATKAVEGAKPCPGLQGRRLALLAELHRFGGVIATAEDGAKSDAFARGKSADLHMELEIIAAVAAAVSGCDSENAPLPPLVFALDSFVDVDGDDEEEQDRGSEREVEEEDLSLKVTVGLNSEYNEGEEVGGTSSDVREKAEKVDGITNSTLSPWKALGFVQGAGGVAALASSKGGFLTLFFLAALCRR